jgi:hypothetical protein
MNGATLNWIDLIISLHWDCFSVSLSHCSLSRRSQRTYKFIISMWDNLFGSMRSHCLSPFNHLANLNQIFSVALLLRHLSDKWYSTTQKAVWCSHISIHWLSHWKMRNIPIRSWKAEGLCLIWAFGYSLGAQIPPHFLFVIIIHRCVIIIFQCPNSDMR